MSEATGEVTTPELRQDIVAKVADALAPYGDRVDVQVVTTNVCAAVFVLLDQRELDALPEPDWTEDGIDGWSGGTHTVRLQPTGEPLGPRMWLDREEIARENALGLAAALRAAAHARVWSSEADGA